MDINSKHTAKLYGLLHKTLSQGEQAYLNAWKEEIQHRLAHGETRASITAEFQQYELNDNAIRSIVNLLMGE